MNTIEITHHDSDSKESFSDNTESSNPKDELIYIKKFAKLLDSQFRIPGTNITFGLDPLIGMIPWLGDLVGYGFSSVLLFSAFKKGVKGEVLAKMLGNMGIDALVGMVPWLGTIFDFAYKANNRNYKLLTEYVEEDKHSGSAWPYLLAFFALTFVVIASVCFGAWSFFSWLFG